MIAGEVRGDEAFSLSARSRSAVGSLARRGRYLLLSANGVVGAKKIKRCSKIPFEWRRLRAQDSMLLAVHHAVRGGASAYRLRDRIGRRYNTASRLVWSTLLWPSEADGREWETALRLPM